MKPTQLGVVTRTARGLEIMEFEDLYGEPCQLQTSSLAILETPGTSAVWLGTVGERMHLNRDRVTSLIGHLQHWLDKGTFEFSPAQRRSRKTTKPKNQKP
ncbi:MAG: hypothetical protein U1G08_18030 [Verrucomicrobiota bacterium]